MREFVLEANLIRCMSGVAVCGVLATLVACQNGGAPAAVTPTAEMTPLATPVPSDDGLQHAGFKDDFSSPRLDTSRWKLFEQSGLVLFKEGRLELLNAGRAKNFPYLVTRRAIIPDDGPFFFEINYEILAAAEIGTSFCLDYAPPEEPGVAHVSAPFMQAYAAGSLMPIFNTENGEVRLEVPEGGKPGKPHKLRVEYGGTGIYNVLFDGTSIGTVKSKRRPSKFWTGIYPQVDRNEVFWPRVALDEVAAGVLKEPAPIPTATPTPTPEPEAKASQP